MIRFLNLKNQICEDSSDFAFYDTISNEILSFDNVQVFDSIEEFNFYFGEEEEGTTRPFSRFLSLIPNDFFEKNK